MRELTAQEWTIVEDIASALAQAQQRFNSAERKSDKGLLTEFKKVLSYYQSLGQGGDLWTYLEVWRKKGTSFGHGGNIEKYYGEIVNIIDSPLKPYKDDRDLLLQLLGWSSRLAAFYAQGQGQSRTSSRDSSHSQGNRSSQAQGSSLAQKVATSKKELKTQLQVGGQDVSLGALLQARIVAKKPAKKEVTYEIKGILFIEPEKKRFDQVPDSGFVWVEIKDEELKHVKFKKLVD